MTKAYHLWSNGSEQLAITKMHVSEWPEGEKKNQQQQQRSFVTVPLCLGLDVHSSLCL